MLWNLATLVGAVAGNAIGDPRTYGLDAAVGAAFLALLWPRLHEPAQPAGRRRPPPRSRSGRCRSCPPAYRCSPPRPWRCSPGSSTKDEPQERAAVIWAAIIATGVGCYLLKLAGLSVPPRVLERPLVERVADLIPVALLAALIAVQVFSRRAQPGRSTPAPLGLGVAVVLLLLRAPFLVVVFGAALVAALVRLCV